MFLTVSPLKKLWVLSFCEVPDTLFVVVLEDVEKKKQIQAISNSEFETVSVTSVNVEVWAVFVSLSKT